MKQPARVSRANREEPHGVSRILAHAHAAAFPQLARYLAFQTGASVAETAGALTAAASQRAMVSRERSARSWDVALSGDRRIPKQISDPEVKPER